MNIFSKWFGRKSARRDYEMAQLQMPMELKNAIARAFGHDRIEEQSEALFLTKDHPPVAQAFENFEGFKRFLDKQAKDIEAEVKIKLGHLDDKHKEYHKMCWSSIEQYMKEHGLWPENYTSGSDQDQLSEREGVMYRVKQVERKDAK